MKRRQARWRDLSQNPSRGGAAPLPEVLRRDATRTPLDGLMREHCETIVARLEDEHGGRRPLSYVERELRGFLACGDPSRGFWRICGPSCARDLLPPFVPVRGLRIVTVPESSRPRCSHSPLEQAVPAPVALFI